jgi:hypothetical protein
MLKEFEEKIAPAEAKILGDKLVAISPFLAQGTVVQHQTNSLLKMIPSSTSNPSPPLVKFNNY